jgi:hypothetical protein
VKGGVVAAKIAKTALAILTVAGVVGFLLAPRGEVTAPAWAYIAFTAPFLLAVAVWAAVATAWTVREVWKANS